MLSSGAIAGIGLGSGLAGLLIGISISAFYPRRFHQDTRDEEAGTSASPAAAPVPTDACDIPPSGPIVIEHVVSLYEKNLVAHIPQALYSGWVKRDIRGLRAGILHISAGLRCPSPRPKLDREALINLIGPRHVDELTELVEHGTDVEARGAARIIFAQAILSHLDADGDPETTLLPADVLSMYQQAVDLDGIKGYLNPQVKLLKDCWRSLTGIMILGMPKRELPVDDARRIRARDLGAAILDILHPFLEGDEFHWHPKLMETLILHTAEHAFTLFMQMDEVKPHWESLWGEDTDGERKLIVFPAVYWEQRPRNELTGVILGMEAKRVQIYGPVFR